MPISDQTREGDYSWCWGWGQLLLERQGWVGQDECLSKTGVLLGQRKVRLHPGSVLRPLQLPDGTQTYLS